MKKTSLPSTPVFQPITASFTPTLSPLYQPISVESVRMNAASQTIRSPEPQMPCDGPAAAGGGRSGSFGSAKKSGCTVRSMGLRPVGSAGQPAGRTFAVPAAAADRADPAREAL